MKTRVQTNCDSRLSSCSTYFALRALPISKHSIDFIQDLIQNDDTATNCLLLLVINHITLNGFNNKSVATEVQKRPFNEFSYIATNTTLTTFKSFGKISIASFISTSCKQLLNNTCLLYKNTQPAGLSPETVVA